MTDCSTTRGRASSSQRSTARRGHTMLPERATFDEGTNSVEAGVTKKLDRMQTGRWKVFANCVGWFEEFRLYHRKDGRIVKIDDDLPPASRYGMMMRRQAICTTPV